jgi:hypothetical protein
MATIRVTTASPVRRIAHPHVVIHSEDGKDLVVPLAAPLKHSGLAAKYETHERVGDYDTEHKTGNPSHTMTTELTWIARSTQGWIDAERSIEPDLQMLRYFAKSGIRLWFIGWGASAGGWWQIRELGIDVLTMKEGTNDATSATVSLTFVKPQNRQLPNGPLTGGAKSVAAVSGVVSATSFVTKPGQTLYAAAYQATGDGELWRKIADANGITQPNLLPAGTTLIIPQV